MSLRKKVQLQEEKRDPEKAENGEADSQSPAEDSRDVEPKGAEMDLDSRDREPEKKDERPSGGTGNGEGGDDDDAVEY